MRRICGRCLLLLALLGATAADAGERASSTKPASPCTTFESDEEAALLSSDGRKLGWAHLYRAGQQQDKTGAQSTILRLGLTLSASADCSLTSITRHSVAYAVTTGVPGVCPKPPSLAGDKPTASHNGPASKAAAMPPAGNSQRVVGLSGKLQQEDLVVEVAVPRNVFSCWHGANGGRPFTRAFFLQLVLAAHNATALSMAHTDGPSTPSTVAPASSRTSTPIPAPMSPLSVGPPHNLLSSGCTYLEVVASCNPSACTPPAPAASSLPASMLSTLHALRQVLPSYLRQAPSSSHHATADAQPSTTTAAAVVPVFVLLLLSASAIAIRRTQKPAPDSSINVICASGGWQPIATPSASRYATPRCSISGIAPAESPANSFSSQHPDRALLSSTSTSSFASYASPYGVPHEANAPHSSVHPLRRSSPGGGGGGFPGGWRLTDPGTHSSRPAPGRQRSSRFAAGSNLLLDSSDDTFAFDHILPRNSFPNNNALPSDAFWTTSGSGGLTSRARTPPCRRTINGLPPPSSLQQQQQQQLQGRPFLASSCPVSPRSSIDGRQQYTASDERPPAVPVPSARIGANGPSGFGTHGGGSSRSCHGYLAAGQKSSAGGLNGRSALARSNSSGRLGCVGSGACGGGGSGDGKQVLSNVQPRAQCVAGGRVSSCSAGGDSSRCTMMSSSQLSTSSTGSPYGASARDSSSSGGGDSSSSSSSSSELPICTADVGSGCGGGAGNHAARLGGSSHPKPPKAPTRAVAAGAAGIKVLIAPPLLPRGSNKISTKGW